jgi:NAD+ kinase
MSGQHVGVLGSERLAEAVEAAGGVPVVGELDALDDVAFVLVDDEDSTVEIVRAGVDVPVLLVGAGEGLPSVPFERIETALDRALAGSARTERHPIVTVSGAAGPKKAVFDVGLMAAEPARISEFSVAGPAGRIARFRADGVVASTPAGSHGYNRRAGGPVVASGTGVASVVPIAPFSTSAAHWVLPIESVELAVEREETPVELLVDGRRERDVDPDETLEFSVTDTFETYLFPELDGGTLAGRTSTEP